VQLAKLQIDAPQPHNHCPIGSRNYRLWFRIATATADLPIGLEAEDDAIAPPQLSAHLG